MSGENICKNPIIKNIYNPDGSIDTIAKYDGVGAI